MFRKSRTEVKKFIETVKNSVWVETWKILKKPPNFDKKTCQNNSEAEFKQRFWLKIVGKIVT